MKRFFCEKCKRIIRVRTLPDILDPQRMHPKGDGAVPIGICDHHIGKSHSAHLRAHRPTAEKVLRIAECEKWAQESLPHA
jgi:hypothetical protein